MSFYRPNAVVHKFFLLAIALTALIIPYKSLSAQGFGAQSEVITIDTVAIDATGENPVQARDTAIVEGQRKALFLLWEKLVPDTQISRIPSVSDSQLASFVRDFSLDNERSSDIRYLADMTVRFRANAVRDFLLQNNVSYTAVSSAPILVLPLWDRGESTILWEEPNPWFAVWRSGRVNGSLVKVTAPLGDIEDVQLLPTEMATNPDPSTVARMEGRYGTSGILISQARLSGEDETLASLTVTSRLIEGANRQTFTINLLQRPDENMSAFLERAARQVIIDLEGQQKSGTIISSGEQNYLLARIPIASFATWIEMQNRIAALGEVADFQLKSLSRDLAVVRIDYYGSFERFANVLQSRRLAIKEIGRPAGRNGVKGDTGVLSQDYVQWEISQQTSLLPQEAPLE